MCKCVDWHLKGSIGHLKGETTVPDRVLHFSCQARLPPFVTYCRDIHSFKSRIHSLKSCRPTCRPREAALALAAGKRDLTPFAPRVDGNRYQCDGRRLTWDHRNPSDRRARLRGPPDAPCTSPFAVMTKPRRRSSALPSQGSGGLFGFFRTCRCGWVAGRALIEPTGFVSTTAGA